MPTESLTNKAKCKIGAHVSSAESVALAPERAKEIGCECFQMFSRPPQGGKAKSIDTKTADLFKAKCKEFKMESYIHAPYYINLASASSKIFYGSVSVLKEELARGSFLGVKYLMTHLGSARELGNKEGLKKVIKGISEVLSGYEGSCEFLIEMSAGAGSIIGDNFEELGEIIINVENKLNSIKDNSLKKSGNITSSSPFISLPAQAGGRLGGGKRVDVKIGICFDTAHAFASGYDLRDAGSVKKTFSDFNKILGIDRLKLIHANDCASEFGSHHDRHAHIGEGNIGLDGFGAIVKFAQSKKINLILETPHKKDSKGILEDIKILKGMRRSNF